MKSNSRDIWVTGQDRALNSRPNNNPLCSNNNPVAQYYPIFSLTIVKIIWTYPTMRISPHTQDNLFQSNPFFFKKKKLCMVDKRLECDNNSAREMDTSIQFWNTCCPWPYNRNLTWINLSHPFRDKPTNTRTNLRFNKRIHNYRII